MLKRLLQLCTATSIMEDIEKEDFSLKTETSGISQEASVSKLRAKREERSQKRTQLNSDPLTERPIEPTVNINTSLVLPSEVNFVSSVAKKSTYDEWDASYDDDSKKRARAENRRILMKFSGSVWDVIKMNDVEMLERFLLVEGSQRMASIQCKSPEDVGRTLLHAAAWYGNRAAVDLLLSSGANVNAIDSTASRTTPLIEAARAGHSDICQTLIRHGANCCHQDVHGDTAFHWAARRGHGSLIINMIHELDNCAPGSSHKVWISENLKGRTTIDYMKKHPGLLSLFQKCLSGKFNNDRLEKKTSRFFFKGDENMLSNFNGAANEAIPRSFRSLKSSKFVESDTNEPSLNNAPDKLSDINSLGLDIAGFAYSLER